MRVLVADDHKIFRQSMISLLEREGFDIVGEAADGAQAVQLACELAPDLAVLDLRMPALDGLEAAREIRERCPHTRSVLLTQYDDDAYVLEALRAGVRAYVLKTQAGAELVTTLRQVAEGALYLSPEISDAALDHYWNERASAGSSLSERELQVLRMVADGHTTQQIAAALGVTPKTIDSHRGRIMRKLGIHGVAGLVRYAIRRGYVET